jgi:hypothetical protein
MRQDMGAIPGSREPSPSSTGLGPSGFDPERVEIYAKGCQAIIERLENNEPLFYAQTIEQLEQRHDRLADEVLNIAGMVRGLVEAIAMEARQGGDGETRLHPKDDSAGPKDIAQ